MRVAIVNDLPLAREALRRVVLSVPGHRIAWVAENGEQAVHLARQDRPDVILMDLVMPVLDGVEATRQIMASAPCPILLVTASVDGNFTQVLQAMGHGGLDAVNTPVLGKDGQVRDGGQLLARLERLDRAAHGMPPPAKTTPCPSPVHPAACPPLLAIGASTGGPEAIAQVLEGLPADFAAPVVVVQHIAAEFAANLVVWLRCRCRLPVEVARAGTIPPRGTVAVAASDDHLVIGANLLFRYTADPVDYPYRPSVNRFFESLAACWTTAGVAVLLTGMGDDGAAGLGRLRRAGWLTIAQDQASCVVYGMPRAAAEQNAACRVMNPRHMTPVILSRLGGNKAADAPPRR